MLGTVDWNHIDKPTAMMGLHLIATIIGLLVLAVSPFSLFVRLGIAVLLQLGIPGITVAYRASQTGHAKHLLEGIDLYSLYYWARVEALALLVVGRSHKYANSPIIDWGQFLVVSTETPPFPMAEIRI